MKIKEYFSIKKSVTLFIELSMVANLDKTSIIDLWTICDYRQDLERDFSMSNLGLVNPIETTSPSAVVKQKIAHSADMYWSL